MFTLRYTEYSYRKHVYDRASEFLIPLLRKHSRVPRGILVWKVAGLNNEGLIDMLVAAFLLGSPIDPGYTQCTI